MFSNLLRLMRPKHYIKNGLVLVPLVFGNQLFNSSKLPQIAVALIMFCLVSSLVYVVNDIRDAPKDRLHSYKQYRPIASGVVSVSQALMLAVALGTVVMAIGLTGGLDRTSWLLLIGYALINGAYSFGLKNIPIIDIALLASGFVIRVLFGASIFNIEVSQWLYMTILAGAFYVSLGKRRNEIITSGTKSRRVNERYSLQFLDKNMYVCLTLTLVFYSLWATDPHRAGTMMYATIPLVLLICMAYNLAIEQNDSTGDPVEVLFKSPALRVLAPICVVLMVVAIYV